MLRKRWADRADLNRCILRSRRRDSRAALRLMRKLLREHLDKDGARQRVAEIIANHRDDRDPGGGRVIAHPASGFSDRDKLT